METALQCMVSKKLSSLCKQLLWVEYVLTPSGLSLFQRAHDFQPTLFSALEKEVAWLSVQVFICQQTWSQKLSSAQLLGTPWLQTTTAPKPYLPSGLEDVAMEPGPTLAGRV